MSRNVFAVTHVCLYVALSAALRQQPGQSPSRRAQAVEAKQRPFHVSSSTSGETGRKETLPEAVQPSRSEQSTLKQRLKPRRRNLPLPSPPSPPAEPAERSALPPPEKPAPAEASNPALTKADTAKPAGTAAGRSRPFLWTPASQESMGRGKPHGRAGNGTWPPTERDGPAAAIQSTSQDGCAGAQARRGGRAARWRRSHARRSLTSSSSSIPRPSMPSPIPVGTSTSREDCWTGSARMRTTLFGSPWLTRSTMSIGSTP